MSKQLTFPNCSEVQGSEEFGEEEEGPLGEVRLVSASHLGLHVVAEKPMKHGGGGTPLAGQAFQRQPWYQSHTHRPKELFLWTGLCHAWTTFLRSWFSTLGEQKGSRQMQALHCVSDARCLCSKTQEEEQAVSWSFGPGPTSLHGEADHRS